MRIVLKVTSSNEYNDGGCEYALVDLTHGLANLALRRIAVLRELKVFDPEILETYYWTQFVDCYFPLTPTWGQKTGQPKTPVSC